MDAVDHPLDWGAYGGYPMMMQEFRCTKVRARHQVHQRIDEYFRRTGDPLWRPIGHRGYGALRRRIMDGDMLDHDLI